MKRIAEIFDETRKDNRDVLLSHETSEIFTIIGVSAPITRLAKNEEEAAKYFKEINGKVVMKIVSP